MQLIKRHAYKTTTRRLHSVLYSYQVHVHGSMGSSGWRQIQCRNWEKKTVGAICGGSMERDIVDHVPRENSKWVRHTCNYGKLVARVSVHLRFPYSPWFPPGRQLFLWSRTGRGERRSREEWSVQLRQQACLLVERQWQNEVGSFLEQLIINHLFEGPAIEIRGKSLNVTVYA